MTIAQLLAADTTHASMTAAFDLVSPAKRAERLAAAGKLSAKAAASVSWRDRIGAIVTDEEMRAAGVSIEQVIDAIDYFTSTKATASRERIAGNGIEQFSPARAGWLVVADGYRSGPAGDH